MILSTPRRSSRRWLSAALLAVTLTPVGVALAQDDAPPPPAQAHCQGGHHDWKHRGHRPMPPMMRALHKLDLSDAQKQSIRSAAKQTFESMKPQWQDLMAKRRAFESAAPGTPEFNTAYSAYAQAAAAAAETRVQQEADLRTQIYGLLTDDQRAQLAKIQAEQAQHRGRHHGPPPPPPAD